MLESILELDILFTTRDNDEEDPMSDYDVVLEYFKKLKAPVSAGTVSEETGVDRKEVDKIMKKMKDETVIVSPKRCYWEFKK